jgi:hypothetical protein
MPNGQLAMLNEERIDVKKFNKQEPTPIDYEHFWSIG